MTAHGPPELKAFALVRHLEIKSLVGLAVAAARRYEFTEELLLGFVMSEWRELARLEARVENAAAAGARSATRRGPRGAGR